MSRYWKKFSVVCLLSFFSFLGFTQEIKIVAVINDEIITSYELDQAMKVFESQLKLIGDTEKRKQTENQSRLNVLEDMIRDRLLEQEMAHLDIQVTQREIDEEVQKLSQRAGLNVSQFESALKSRGLSMDKYRESIGDHLKLLKFISRKIRPKVQIDEEDIRLFYEQNSIDFIKPEQIQLLQISYSKNLGQKPFKSIKSEIQKGVSLDFVQKKYPKSRFSNLGVIEIKDLSNELQKSLKEVKEGEFTRNISQGSQWQFYQVLSRKTGEKVGLEEVKDMIHAKLLERQIEQELDLYLRNLRARAHVEVRI